MICGHCDARFPFFGERPVLLRRDNTIFPPEAYTDLQQAPVQSWKSWLMRLIPCISVNLASSRCLMNFRERLAGRAEAAVLVVGGGSQRTWLDNRFVMCSDIRLFYCDVDADAMVDCYCDAHELPFVDGCFDGVITTAVLEHVLYPERVAAEIHRVLKPDGVLYSEIPFMQHVHEGAYDFTRYTLSGHRRLFNRFAEIESGLVAGPATALVWAIEGFALAFFSGKYVRSIVKAMVRVVFFWLKYFDYFLEGKPQAMDGASCTYFLGRKQVVPVPDREIINGYIGATHLRHV